MGRWGALILLAACRPADTDGVADTDADDDTDPDTTAAWTPDPLGPITTSTGRITTAGGDAVGTDAPGRGGDVAFYLGEEQFAPFHLATEDLVVSPSIGVRLGPNTTFRHCRVDGPLVVSGAVDLVCAGHFLVGPTGEIRGRDGDAGARLVVHVQGGFQIDGVIDLAAQERAAGDDGPGAAGGHFELWTTAPGDFALPTVITRGGDANLRAAGAPGGDVTVHVVGGDAATTLILSGAAPLPERIHSRTAWFDACGEPCAPAWRELDGSDFRRGVLTSGGLGGDAPDVASGVADDGGAGGRGGRVSIIVEAPHRLDFDHIDVFTGQRAEPVDVNWQWDYGIGLAAFTYLGSGGGAGGFAATGVGGSGGAGGAGGDLTVQATLARPIAQRVEDAIAWDGCPAIPEIGSSGARYVADEDDPSYRLSAAGGWGGVLGASRSASPSETYPARFGAAGAEGAVSLALAAP